MYLVIPFLPLLASLLGSPRRSIMAIALAVLCSTLAFIEIVFMGSAVTLKLQVSGYLWYWFTSLAFSVEWCLLFDGLTVSMLIAIMYVSLLVQIYSFSYMSLDPHLIRFYGYLSLFTFAMTLLVTADNLVVLFMGWEFVGISSYLLINFWFSRKNANLAALKAFLLNRIGDWALALGLLLVLSLIYDFSTASIFSLASYIHQDFVLAICLFLIIGASAKSALVLFGLHTWLPQAMEGPTPVSALIHAATMVTAGIYLFLRLGPLFQCCDTALLIITWLGGLGSILGAISGLLLNDLKKVTAYSTISQLGYMTVACGCSQYSLALFHLLNHAFFKALLFLSAGAIIHAFRDEQDMRKMGSFGLLLPWTYSFVLLGIESMMAFPFISGFYSKDFLLELALVPHNTTISVAYILMMAAAILTATYSTRMLILTLIGQPNFAISNLVGFSFVGDSHLWLPLVILSMGAAIFGFMAHELFLSNATPLVSLLLPVTHSYNYKIMLLPITGQPAILLFSCFFISTALMIFSTYRTQQRSFYFATNLLANWNNYNGQIIRNSQTFSLMVSRYWDRGLIELLGPFGLLRLFHYATFKLELLSTGFLPHSFITIFIFILTSTLLPFLIF